MYLIICAQGRSMNDFLNRFRKKDYVNNDPKVIVHKLARRKICKTWCHQDTHGSLRGVHHLLN